VEIGGGVAAQSQPLAFAAARYSEAAEQATRTVPPSTVASDGLDLDRLQVQTSTPTRPMLVILGIAFLGGLILNVMPCVLPVIGLKVMSFAQQAGESRARVFALNLWYSLGLVSVFLVLATLAVVWKLGWGEQFNSDQFNIVMVSVVFTMGLSFLGVWEIPIPGFVGGGKASELAEKEGPTGAFVKGVVTTLLATPCSGPGLATALTWCSNKPAPLVYLVFTVMGLGMASPYLLIGANPKLVRLLPKPGAWMDTLKQTMGFILLGTVVYMLTFVRWANVLPTLALLFGLWAACWWIGRTPITEEFQVRLRAWGVAIVFAFVIGLFAFGEQFLLGDYTVYGLRGIMEHRLTEFVDKRVQDRLEDQGAVAREAPPPEPRDRGFELPWEPFSTVKLKQLADGGKTVLVDFTAKWCLTCKFLEHTVLNTKEVRQAVDENGVVTLIADWTDRDPEMGRLLEALGSKQVPVVAIFPAGKPNQPIVLLGGYTQQTLLAKLREAGPSQATAKSAGRDHSFRSTIRPMRQLGSPASSNVRWMLSA
jgi:thiol:disulfide interchange protein